MRCHICDRPLANDEIKHEPKYGRGGFNPCGSCLTIVEEIFEPESEEEIDRQLAEEFYTLGISSAGDDNHQEVEEKSSEENQEDDIPF